MGVHSSRLGRWCFDPGELPGPVLGVSTANARNPEDLREGKAGDQRAATNAGCEEDQFFGNDLHSNSCRGGDEGQGDRFS